MATLELGEFSDNRGGASIDVGCRVRLFGGQVKESNVHVVFDGLCPIVPSFNLEHYSAKQPWVGSFLVNANFANQQRFSLRRPLHLPFLEFNLKDLHGEHRFPDTRVAWRLRGEDVVLIPPRETSPGVEILYGDCACGREQSEDWLNWVPRIDDVEPRMGTIDPDCFKVRPQLGRVVARVHMRHGQLSSGAVAKMRNEEVGEAPLIVEMRKTGKSQMITARVVLKMWCVPGLFKIGLHSFDGAGGYRELVLRVPEEGALDLRIANHCMRSLLTEEARDSSLEPDKDFLWNYILSDIAINTPINRLEVPRPVRFGDVDVMNISDVDAFLGKGGGGADAARCSPPRYKAPAKDLVKSLVRFLDSLEQKEELA